MATVERANSPTSTGYGRRSVSGSSATVPPGPTGTPAIALPTATPKTNVTRTLARLKEMSHARRPFGVSAWCRNSTATARKIRATSSTMNGRYMVVKAAA